VQRYRAEGDVRGADDQNKVPTQKEKAASATGKKKVPTRRQDEFRRLKRSFSTGTIIGERTALNWNIVPEERGETGDIEGENCTTRPRSFFLSRGITRRSPEELRSKSRTGRMRGRDSWAGKKANPCS